MLSIYFIVYYLFNAVHLLAFPTEVSDASEETAAAALYSDTRTALDHYI